MRIRERTEQMEKQYLRLGAALSAETKGRERFVPPCDIRTAYQRDRDRITHSKSFRRLMNKTQVFLSPEGDHYRTRLTHTLEVCQIARTISRALRLNEDLTEAIALGHDLGHTPFGHAGESALNGILFEDGGFSHNEQSLRVVDSLERDGQGLNLTHEVRNGILCHTGEENPATPEGVIIRIADRIAYLNHDVDDAVRAGILRETDIPSEITCAFGSKHGERVNSLILDMVSESAKCGEVTLSPHSAFVFNLFHSFMMSNVYKNLKAKSEERKVLGILSKIYGYYINAPDELPEDFRRIAAKDGLRRAVSDYVSGMTDKYAIHVYEKLFIPEAWQVR